MVENNHEEHSDSHESHKNINHEKKHRAISSNGLTESLRENPWILSTAVLGVILLFLLIVSFTGITGKSISEEKAGELILSFAASQGVSVDLVGVKEENSFYEVTISLQGQDFPLYVTKDGNYMVQSLIPLGEPKTSIPSAEASVAPKSDKPEAELFIMTHCPYGTQAEKGFIPMINEMKDLIDYKIRFVHYFMHGEIEENETYAQICIREEQPQKYLEYLVCFLEDGNSSRCLTKTKVDFAKMKTCISNGKAKEYYDLDSQLSEQYGVQGSPSLVLNGVQVSSGRSPSAYLSVVCDSFNNAPNECASLDLSSASPSPMWGWDTTASSATAQC